MERVVEPYDEVQLNFAGPLHRTQIRTNLQLNTETYILVAIDSGSKVLTAKFVSNTMADIAIKLMQRFNSKKRYHDD